MERRERRNAVTVLAPAKLNLALDVVGLLPNGYHALDMTMQTITLYERVMLRRSAGLSLRLPGSLVQPNDKNTAIKAALAFFHRKRPSKKIPLFLQLDEGIREEVRLLSLFLTLAERMDKSHRQIIRSARFGRTPDGELELCLRASEVCPIEIEEIGRSHKLIKKTFHTHFTLCPCLENGAPIV